jgi:hypothetical protein
MVRFLEMRGYAFSGAFDKISQQYFDSNLLVPEFIEGTV